MSSSPGSGRRAASGAGLWQAPARTGTPEQGYQPRHHQRNPRRPLRGVSRGDVARKEADKKLRTLTRFEAEVRRRRLPDSWSERDSPPRSSAPSSARSGSRSGVKAPAIPGPAAVGRDRSSSLMKSIMSEQLISEALVPVVATSDTARMAIGEPGLPREFLWRAGPSASLPCALLALNRKCHHGARTCMSASTGTK